MSFNFQVETKLFFFLRHISAKKYSISLTAATNKFVMIDFFKVTIFLLKQNKYYIVIRHILCKVKHSSC